MTTPRIEEVPLVTRFACRLACSGLFEGKGDELQKHINWLADEFDQQLQKARQAGIDEAVKMKIGDVTISKKKDGSYWLENRDDEGVQVNNIAVESALEILFVNAF